MQSQVRSGLLRLLLLMTAIGSPDLDSPAVAREGSPDLGCPNLGRFDHRQQEREKAVLSLADQIAVIKSIKMMGSKIADCCRCVLFTCRVVTLSHPFVLCSPPHRT